MLKRRQEPQNYSSDEFLQRPSQSWASEFKGLEDAMKPMAMPKCKKHEVIVNRRSSAGADDECSPMAGYLSARYARSVGKIRCPILPPEADVGELPLAA